RARARWWRCGRCRRPFPCRRAAGSRSPGVPNNPARSGSGPESIGAWRASTPDFLEGSEGLVFPPLKTVCAVRQNRDRPPSGQARYMSTMNERDGRPLDLFVVGGGINGAGIACDAAGRALKVGLCEMNDFASGTSSKATKLIHGGLRYLEHYEFRLVREALME